MRALIVTNMYPSAERPAHGSFVRDQVEALRRVADVEVELFAFAGGRLSAYPSAAAALRRRFGGTRFDVVHAHFGLTAWPALAARAAVRGVTLHGTDLAHPRSRAITLGRAAPLRARRGGVRAARALRAALGGAAARSRYSRSASPPIGSCRSRATRRARAGARSGSAARALPGRPGPAGEAVRPRPPGRRRRTAPRARKRRAGARSRFGSTLPTRCWSRPSAKGSGSPCSRRSRATCRCSRRRSGSRRRCFATSRGRTAVRSSRARGPPPWPRTWPRPTPESPGARSGLFSTDRMATRPVAAWRALLGDVTCDGFGPRADSYTRPLSGGLLSGLLERIARRRRASASSRLGPPPQNGVNGREQYLGSAIADPARPNGRVNEPASVVEEPEAVTEIEPETVADPGAVAEPEVAAEPEAEDVAEPEPEPEPESEPEPEPKAGPERSTLYRPLPVESRVAEADSEPRRTERTGAGASERGRGPSQTRNRRRRVRRRRRDPIPTAAPHPSAADHAPGRPEQARTDRDAPARALPSRAARGAVPGHRGVHGRAAAVRT